MLDFLNVRNSFVIFIGILVISFALSWTASRFFYSVANKYFKYSANNSLTGSEVVKKMLADHGIYNVTIAVSPSNNRKKVLADNFNPISRVITLSNEVYYGKSVSAQAIAMHEAGHAIQYKNNYTFALVRNKLASYLSIINYVFFPLLIISLFTFSPILFLVIIGFFLFSFIFQLVTLPVEFNASKIAFEYVKNCDIKFTNAEFNGIKSILRRAAFTYIATALGTLIFLLYLILINLR